MKKGDLVKLAEGQSWTQREAETMGFESISKIPEFLEVESTDFIVMCCIPVATFKVVGVENFTLWQDNFEVVLPANELDVNQLIKESKQNELAWIGM